MKLVNIKITPEEMERWKPILLRTWSAIAADAEEGLPQRRGKQRREQIVELVCDANRPIQFGMTHEEYQVLQSLWIASPTLERWVNDLFQNA